MDTDKNPRTDTQRALKEHQPEFWWLAARRLKRTADLTWGATRTARALRPQGPAGMSQRSRAAQDLDTAYLFLAVLAIEYLAIGALVGREPGHFLRTLPKHHIRELVQRCGVTLQPAQERLLRRVETALQWRERFGVGETREESALTEAALELGEESAPLEEADRATLDALFQTLKSALAAELLPESGLDETD